MKKLLVLALALTFVFGFAPMVAARTAGPAYIWTQEYMDWNGQAVAEIDQNMNNFAHESSALIEQFGYNYAGIGQHGRELEATIDQHGYRNFVRISQGWNGIGNEANVTQAGGEFNRVRIKQRGEDNLINVSQDEFTERSYALIYQQGEGNEILVNQFNGVGNHALVMQDNPGEGYTALATIHQGNGNNNDAEIMQNMTAF